MVNYHALETKHFKDIDFKARSLNRPELVHIEDPATTVLWDFNKMCPNFAGAKQNADNALEEMNSLNAHWLFVVDEAHKPIGLISSEDVLGAKPTKVIKECNITRDKLITKMLMTPISEVQCIEADLLKVAKVGHIVETLKATDSMYLLVVEPFEDGHRLYGLFHRLQISNQLHESVF